MTTLQRIDHEIAAAQAALRRGDPREQDIALGLQDWHAERRMVLQEREMAPAYIRANFQPNDRVALVLINRNTGASMQRISTADRISQPDAQEWLREMNQKRSDIYISQNTLAPDARTRQKPDVQQIRHVYAEFDEDATARVRALQDRPGMPAPNHIIESSPGKYQVIWKVEGFDKDQAERLMRGMVREFGADPACTDCSRVLRLPGFQNHKYDRPHMVTVQTVSNKTARPEDFPKFTESPQPSYTVERNGTKRADGAPISQSEKDWAYAKSHLARGDDPAAVVQAIVSYRAPNEKYADPSRYAERTVRNALIDLNRNGSRTR